MRWILICLTGVYGCARTSDTGTTVTTAASITTATTLPPGVTTTTVGTTVPGQTTTSSTTTTTTTTENLALTCTEAQANIGPDPNIPGSSPAAGAIMVVNGANNMVVTCTAMTTANTVMSIGIPTGDVLTGAPAPTQMTTLVCDSTGKWTFGTSPETVTHVYCQDA